MTKSLVNLQSDPSQKVYQFYKGSLQKVQKQSSQCPKKLGRQTLDVMISQMVNIQRSIFGVVLKNSLRYKILRLEAPENETKFIHTPESA